MDSGESSAPAKGASKATDVIVIDDDASVREAVKKFLNDKGFSVLEAESGAHALKLLDRMAWNWSPTAFVTDIVMPGTSGYELIRALTNRYKAKKVPLIVMSRLATRDDIIEAELAGAHAFVVKPFRLGRLFEALQGVVENLGKPVEERKKTIQVFGNQ